MTITSQGISIFPRYHQDELPTASGPAIGVKRIATGVLGLDELVGGGLLRRSVSFVSGSSGTGKTTMGVGFLLKGTEGGERGLYVTLEEAPDQLVANSESLGLPLRAAVVGGLVEILHVSREHLRAGQLPSALAERADRLGASRVVLDGLAHTSAEANMTSELGHLLSDLATRFKALGVTSLFLLESHALHAEESITEPCFSPVADNLFMLRYATTSNELVPTITIVKTRGSAHDHVARAFVIEPGGARVGSPIVGRRAAPRLVTELVSEADGGNR